MQLSLAVHRAWARPYVRGLPSRERTSSSLTSTWMGQPRQPQPSRRRPDAALFAARADVTNEDEVARAVDLAIATFGRLDICVANAGVLIAEAIETFPAEKWRLVMNVDLFGYFLPQSTPPG